MSAKTTMAPVTYKFRPGAGPGGPCLICKEATAEYDLRYQTLIDGKHFAQAGAHRTCVRAREDWTYDPARPSNAPGEITV